jgi:mono/diheme cytochrome c family protein
MKRLLSIRSALAAATVLAALAGCQQKMASQPSYKPLEPSKFFADGRSSRPLVPGTVARGQLRTNLALYTGRKSRPKPLEDQRPAPPNANGSKRGFDENRDFVTEFPLAVDEALIRHGGDRFEIYCVVCHDPLGTGHGKIVERGYTRPPSYHIARLREAPVGRFFAVISEGYGSMPSYAGQIPVEDRWAIVAYVRALQLSQHYSVDELTPEMRDELAAGNASTSSKSVNP